jgi:1-acyl-sn-glycerol-3-phosphate acyltransferase
LITGLKVLSVGDGLGIFPEGTSSPDGWLYTGRTGIARMALESGAAIVPVAMFNTAEIQPTGKVVPKVQRVEMIFGEPLYYTGDTSDLKVLREITDEIMNKIQELSGQEYVDMYASEAKLILMKQRREEMKDKKREEK